MSDTTDRAELIAGYSQLPLSSEYMRVVAHDVRNRMNTIMMANDILPDELQDAEGDPLKYIAMIHRAGEDILVILEAAVIALKGRDNPQEES